MDRRFAFRDQASQLPSDKSNDLNIQPTRIYHEGCEILGGRCEDRSIHSGRYSQMVFASLCQWKSLKGVVFFNAGFSR